MRDSTKIKGTHRNSKREIHINSIKNILSNISNNKESTLDNIMELTQSNTSKSGLGSRRGNIIISQDQRHNMQRSCQDSEEHQEETNMMMNIKCANSSNRLHLDEESNRTRETQRGLMRQPEILGAT